MSNEPYCVWCNRIGHGPTEECQRKSALTNNPNQHQKVADELEQRLKAPTRDAAEGAPIGEDTPYWRILREALLLHVEDQHKIATDLAANCGYELTGDAYTRPSPAVAAEPDDRKKIIALAGRIDAAHFIKLIGMDQDVDADEREFIVEALQRYAIPPVRGDREDLIRRLRAGPASTRDLTAWRALAKEAVDALSLPVRGDREALAMLLDKIAKEKSNVYLSSVCTFAMADAILSIPVQSAPDREAIADIIAKNHYGAKKFTDTESGTRDQCWRTAGDICSLQGQSGAGERDDSAQNCDCDPARVGCVCTCERSVHEDGT